MVFEITMLKEIRKRIGITQKQFAFKAGVSQSLIAKIESGRIDPAYSKVKRIEEAISELTKEKEAEAKDIATPKIIFARPEESAREIIKVMNKNAISQMPILEKNSVVGLVSESSILSKEIEKIKFLKARDLMIEPPPIVSENTKISVISSLLHYFSLVVITKKGKPFGVITKSDLLRSLA